MLLFRTLETEPEPVFPVFNRHIIMIKAVYLGTAF